MASQGFPAEARAFQPHLTLARVRERLTPAERDRLNEALQSVEAAPHGTFPVDAVSLVESTLKPSGAAYRTLSRMPLSAP